MFTGKKYAINLHISLTVQLTGNPEAGLVIGQPFIRTLDPVIGQPGSKITFLKMDNI